MQAQMIACIIPIPAWIHLTPGMEFIRMICGITMWTMMTTGIILPIATIIPIMCGGIVTQSLKDPGLYGESLIRPARELQAYGRPGEKRESIESAMPAMPGSTGLK